MTITRTQADAISGYLQRIGFQGHIFDPNDHDESVHRIPIPSAQPFWIFSFKPAISPRVINGGNMFTYGVAADSFDAIVTSRPVDHLACLYQGMRTLKKDGLVLLCVEDSIGAGDRALFAKLNVSYLDIVIPKILVGRFRGGA